MLTKNLLLLNTQTFILFFLNVLLGCTNYLAYGVGKIIELSALYLVNNSLTQRECEALCSQDPGCRGAAHHPSDQNCGLFDSGTSQEYSWCLNCTGYAKQCPPGTDDVITFTHRHKQINTITLKYI